ncbi:MAG: signal peptidase I [Ruminococcaceae bacterium]|nr:signal peptidase I [Oscillospiraceae bacterium]
MKNPSDKKTTFNKVTEYIYSVFSTFLLCMLVIFTAFTFFFRLVQVSGDSMYPTLYRDDRIIISNFLYNPDYGDIIAFSKKGAKEESMIKRIIGLPGDTVMIDFNSHVISVNNKVIYEDYEVTEAIKEPGDITFPVTVPEDSVFVLGDNRNNSIDSRYSEVGFVSLDEINGKALVRLLPFGKFRLY